jgi:hypothetical protein
MLDNDVYDSPWFSSTFSHDLKYAKALSVLGQLRPKLYKVRNTNLPLRVCDW